MRLPMAHSIRWTKSTLIHRRSKSEPMAILDPLSACMPKVHRVRTTWMQPNGRALRHPKRGRSGKP